MTALYTYCLFCETAKCGVIAEIIHIRTGCRSICAKQVQHTWSKGKMVDHVRDLLPGYIFLYAEDAPLDIQTLFSVSGVIRCLSTSDQNYELSGEDRQFAMMLLEKNGVIGKTAVYREGERICIRSGAFAGTRTEILRVDRRNQRMQIEIPFAGRKVRTWVEYEMVDSAETDPSSAEKP